MRNSKLDGFLGIEFGSSLEIVKEKFTNKMGITLDSVDDENDTLYCNGARFAGRETEMMLFLFFDNKFCKAVTTIKPNLKSKVIETYKQIRDEINMKYYTSESDYEIYYDPYEKNDGYTEAAISLGKAEFSCYWNFNNSGMADNYISINIDENLQIKIGYEDGELMEEFVKRNQEKNSLDY